MSTLPPPIGYHSLKLLNRNDYVRLLAPREVPSFTQNVPLVPLGYSEVTVAAWHYPIIFIQDKVFGGYTMAALAGLGRNVFGRETDTNTLGWAPDAYVPAYLRRYPFCLATVKSDQHPAPEFIVCVEASHVSSEPAEGAIRLFDESDTPTPQWGAIETFLKEYEEDLKASRAFTSRLAELELLEPFTVSVVRPGGEQQNVTGMFRVNEAKLADLNADTVAALHHDGFLSRLYIHLFSLQRFRHLLERESHEQGTLGLVPVLQDVVPQLEPVPRNFGLESQTVNGVDVVAAVPEMQTVEVH